MRTARLHASTLALVGSFALLLVACGGEEPSSAAGGEAGDGETGKTEQAVGLCTELTKVPERCGQAAGGACVAKLASSCDGFASLLNPKLVDAAATCVSEISCDAVPTSCLAKMAGALEPTEAQAKLAKAFCDSCSPVSGATCEGTFLSMASPLGKVILPLGDSIANEIAEACASGLTCAATFPTCAQSVVTRALTAKLDKDALECLLAAVVGAESADGAEPATGDDDPAGNTSSGGTSSGGTSSGGTSSGGTSSGGTSSGGTPTTPPPAGTPTYDLYLDKVEAFAQTASGSAWDAFGGLPDLVVTAEAQSGASRWANTFTGTVDSLASTFTAPILTNVSEAVFKAPSATNRLRITVVDADVAFGDPVGDCAIGSWSPASVFSSSSWNLEGTGQVACSTSAEGGPGYKLNYRLVRR